MKNLRILIADDHEVARDGMRLLLERQAGWTVCAAASTGREAVDQARNLQPDIAILDMCMPEINGLDAARQIKRLSPKTELLIFTAHESEQDIQQVFEAGVKSYILKTGAGAHLVEAVRAVSQHKPFFTSKVADELFARFVDRSAQRDALGRGNYHLTTREREILRLLAEGKANKEVANALGVSVRTAETHRANLFQKLRTSSLAGLIRYAIRNRIVEV